jgi:hypothetical protein
MNAWLLTTAIATVRAWTWLYTLPLDSTARHARRTEIRSDTWEFEQDRSRHESPARRAFHLFARVVFGMPNDLIWSCEQLREHPRPLRLSVVFRLVVVGVAASGWVVFATGPTLDPAHTLRVNVASTGWIATGFGNASLRAPVFVFTLTNAGDRRTRALQVNALFYRDGPEHRRLGTAFASAVGGRGLAPGATSPSLILRAQGWAFGDSSVPPSRVKLFVKHDGRWTLLADLPIRPQLMQPE